MPSSCSLVMETCFTEQVHSLQFSPSCRETFQRQPATSQDVPSMRVERNSPGAVAEVRPWLSVEQGASQAVPKAARAVSQLCGAKEVHSVIAGGFLGDRNHRLHFLQDLPSQPSSALPGTAQGVKRGLGGLCRTAGSWGGTAEPGPCSSARVCGRLGSTVPSPG